MRAGPRIWEVVSIMKEKMRFSLIFPSRSFLAGVLSLLLARHFSNVIGIDPYPSAIEDAKINAKANGTQNVKFIPGKIETVRNFLESFFSFHDLIHDSMRHTTQHWTLCGHCLALSRVLEDKNGCC